MSCTYYIAFEIPALMRLDSIEKKVTLRWNVAEAIDSEASKIFDGVKEKKQL